MRKKRKKMTISTHLVQAIYRANKLPEPLGIQTWLALIPFCNAPKTKRTGIEVEEREKK